MEGYSETLTVNAEEGTIQVVAYTSQPIQQVEEGWPSLWRHVWPLYCDLCQQIVLLVSGWGGAWPNGQWCGSNWGCLMQHCDYLCCKVVCWYGTEHLSTAGVPSCVESVYQERFNPLLDGLTPLSKLMRFWCRATNKNALRKRLSWNHVVLKVLFLNKREMTSTFVLIPKETVLFILHSNKYM